VADHSALSVVCDQPMVEGVLGHAQARGGDDVGGAGEELQPSGFQAQPGEEHAQRGLIGRDVRRMVTGEPSSSRTSSAAVGSASSDMLATRRLSAVSGLARSGSATPMTALHYAIHVGSYHLAPR
jgi:hypothetical protein